jgi:hypothetical protein
VVAVVHSKEAAQIIRAEGLTFIPYADGAYVFADHLELKDQALVHLYIKEWCRK